ncbi:MAG: Sua5/YciO/YrdC/YwlC family protein [Methylococcaceae bacterium]|nr:Sua5/YciO/YrdC/YwlC family protein [Methylococcaceae bacterium]
MSWVSRLRLRLAVRQLRRGGLLAYPTEAVWGLGCDPCNEAAVDSLLALKRRPVLKGLILIGSDSRQIEPFLDLKAHDLRRLAGWPGPITWIVPASSQTPAWLRGDHDTIAVRVTAHPLSSALCQAFGGALVSTSANPTGSPPARTRLKVRAYFSDAELVFLPGKTGGLAKPTAIFDARSGKQLR